MTRHETRLIILLRGLAIINVAAIVAVIAPRSWIAASHRLIGLGAFPAAPIASYLARSTSLWFASFGALLWYLSLDVRRHAPVIRFLGWAMLAQGLFMIGVDVHEGMPIWWTASEGPTCLILGAALLGLSPRQSRGA